MTNKRGGGKTTKKTNRQRQAERAYADTIRTGREALQSIPRPTVSPITRAVRIVITK